MWCTLNDHEVSEYSYNPFFFFTCCTISHGEKLRLRFVSCISCVKQHFFLKINKKSKKYLNKPLTRSLPEETRTSLMLLQTEHITLC